LFDHQNNITQIARMLKLFAALSLTLNILHNYFNGPKIIFGFHLAKFLDASAKPFFHITTNKNKKFSKEF